MNIPIYRAKEIDGEEYIIGSLDFNASRIDNTFYHIITGDRYNHTIDPTTLAIHFESMIDSEGNKIFASLSEDGKGGDIVELEHIRYLEDDEPSHRIKGLCIVRNSSFLVEDIDNKFDRVFYDEMGCNFRNEELEVIGIQE